MVRTMMKVIAYCSGPSGIFRVRHYIQPLKSSGIQMRECQSWSRCHPPFGKWLRPFWAISNLTERAVDTVKSFAYDMVFFQREMLSTFVTWEPFTKRPRIFDVDDALWINRGGRFARRLAAMCDHVICGNSFLAEEFSRWNPSVSVLPTSVNVHRFCPRAAQACAERPIIGWSGLWTNYRFLYNIEPALREVLRRNPSAIFRVVSGEPPRFYSLPDDQVEYIRWTPENEARTIQEMTIGIMPLDDTVYSRGKCSYKMLRYMSCGLPVVVSPIGMNVEVLQKGNPGFGASNQGEWVEYLDALLKDPGLRSRMGASGREVVLHNYSVETLAPQMAKTLLSVAGNGRRQD